jgi:hypothetical protein
VFAASLAALELIEAHFKRFSPDGLHFEGWTSELLMQSVSLRDLAAAPFTSLWYLHVQPPVCNLIRAVLAALPPHATGNDLIRAVDADLYQLWAIAAAGLAVLIHRWLGALGAKRCVAAFFTAGWVLHPANLAFATLEDGTILSALFTTWIVYETWWLARSPQRSTRRLGAAVLLAYFTRSVYQWPFVGVIVASLALARVPRRRIAKFAAAVGLIVGLYSGKQLWLFGTACTSTLAGTNLTRSIGARCEDNQPIPPGRLTSSQAAVLTNPAKLDGTTNYNHRDRLAIERGLLACYRRELGKRSVWSLAADYRENLGLYFQPSSAYVSNVVADHLPWRGAYDRVFSGNRLLWAAIVAGALAFWPWRRRWRAALAVALPVAYVLVVCVVAERGENQRFKFFLEPAAYVLIAIQLYRVVAFLSARVRPARRSDRRGIASSIPLTPAPSPLAIPSAEEST